MADKGLIPPHGGYANSRSWQLADLVYDVTVLFCEKFIPRADRTHDQMVQSARSGAQNLQEGSIDSAISKKMEIKLTGVARGCLMELQQDYRKYLKHRGLPEWRPEEPPLQRFKARRCASLEDFREWVALEVRRWTQETGTHTHPHGQTRPRVVPVRDGPCRSVSRHEYTATCAANGALSLLNLAIYFVRRQMTAQASDFEQNGGFTERLYRLRRQRRDAS